MPSEKLHFGKLLVGLISLALVLVGLSMVLAAALAVP